MMCRNCVYVLLFATLSVVVVGCEDESEGPPPTALFPIDVDVQDQHGVGLPAVPVQFGATTVGYTDAEGRFRAHLERPIGESVEISVGATPHYTYITPTSRKFELTANTSAKNIEPAPISFSVKATSDKKEGWIWVKANCDETLGRKLCVNLPVEVNGLVQAYTNAAGLAQIYVHELPETELVVRIDTPSPAEILERLQAESSEKAKDSKELGSGKPLAKMYDFNPPDPKYTFTLLSTPTLYSIIVDFTDALAGQKVLAAKQAAAATPPPAAKKAPKKTPPRRPKRAKRARPKRNKPKKSGIINVF